MSSPHLPFRRGWIALAVLAAASALALACASGARAAQTPIAAGAGLDWGLKESWRTYIGEQGTSLSAGASRNLDGTFHFPVTGGSYDDVTRNTTVQFGGTVQFLSHCSGGVARRPCELDLTMADPRVEITEDGAFLYAKMTSRPISGGEIVDYPQVKIAELDVEETAPVLDGGTTRWAGLPATVAVEGAAVFTYPVGTVIDPVGFGYDGPGGKPAGETWSRPGEVRYAGTPLARAAGATVKWTRPGRNADELLAIYGQDSSGFALVDATTFEVKPGTRVPSLDAEPGSIAFDPVSATVFSSSTGVNVPITALTWDGTSWTGGPIAGSEIPRANGFDVGGGVWDATGRRYLLPRLVEGVQQLWEVRQVSGAWTSAVIGPIRGGNGLPIPLIADLELVPNGFGQPPALVGADANGGVVRQLHVVGGSVIAEPLEAARGASAVTLHRTRAGLYLVGAREVVFLPIRYNSLLVAETPAVDVDWAGAQSTWLYAWATTDAARDRLYLVNADRTGVMRFDAGALQHTIAPRPEAGLMRHWTDFLAGATKDGKLVHSIALTDGSSGEPNVAPGLTGRVYASRTATFTRQPSAQSTVVQAAGETNTATFTVTVAGDPAPTLRWQTRAPGQSRWSDVADGNGVSGATSASLTVTAGVADNGRQFRAIASNAGGEVASARVALDVHTPPAISVEPDDLAVVAGTPAQLKVMPLGNPAPAITWQQQVGGFWREVDAGSGDFDVDGGFLTVVDPTVAMSGARFRAKLANAVGTRFSRAVTLSVHRPITSAVTFGGGHLDWGVSNRWRCYVVGTIARGAIEVSGGASQIPGTRASGDLCRGRDAGSEALRFPVQGGTYDPASGRLEVQLGGAVRFWGHDHHPGVPRAQLDTTLSNLRVVVEGDGGTLFADAVGATMENPAPVTRTGVALARLDASGRSLVPGADGAALRDLPAALTAAGSPVFGNYPEGEPLDPLSLSLVYGTPRVEPPVVVPPREEPPVVKPPVARPAAVARVAGVRGVRRLGPGRVATVATIVCPAGAACRVTVPKTVVARIGGKRFKLAVAAPKTVKAGKRALVRVRLSRAAADRLRGRKTTVRVKTTVAAGSAKTTRTIAVTLAAKKAAKKKIRS